ncbi:MAG: DegV family protein [Eubacteriales bacterium]|nr:DegV family protein [Eubacteriales bacterium]
MRPYVITTDSSADLPASYLEEKGIPMTSLSCLLDGETYNGDHPIGAKELYQRIREGAMPTTSQVNPEQARAMFEPLVKEGKDVLHLAFSSGLSGSCQSAAVAAQELMEEYPECRIVVVDTLLASLGQGLLVYKAQELKESGASLDETARWCEEAKERIASYVTVDDLYHLYRGGRVSRSSAVLGSMVGIKPIIRVNEEGKLEVIGKVRGRRKAIQTIVGKLMDGIADGETTVFISHGDCLEEAEAIRDQLKSQYGIQNVLIDFVGPVIGAHTGAGVLAIFALSKTR